MRGLAALDVLRETWGQRAVNPEKSHEGTMPPQAGKEIELLARLWDGYEESLQRLGFVRRANGEIGPMLLANQVNPTQVNIYEALAESMRGLPEGERSAFFATLRKVRDAKQRARMAEPMRRSRRGCRSPADRDVPDVVRGMGQVLCGRVTPEVRDWRVPSILRHDPTVNHRAGLRWRRAPGTIFRQHSVEHKFRVPAYSPAQAFAVGTHDHRADEIRRNGSCAGDIGPKCAPQIL